MKLDNDGQILSRSHRAGVSDGEAEKQLYINSIMDKWSHFIVALPKSEALALALEAAHCEILSRERKLQVATGHTLQELEIFRPNMYPETVYYCAKCEAGFAKRILGGANTKGKPRPSCPAVQTACDIHLKAKK